MDTKTFFENFETIANAPGGIARLRELILDLAVRGSLVDQNLAEASPQFEQNDGLFEVAPNWIWTSLEKVGTVNPRNSGDDDLDAGFVPMALVNSATSSKHEFEVRKWGAIKKGYTHLADGDVAVAKITPCFENGKACVIQNLPNGFGAGTTELLVVRPNGVSPQYLLIFLKSPFFRNNGIPQMTGTAGQKRLPTGYFKTFPLPLPPIAEQIRIVAKVDDLMALCDQLESAQQRRDLLRTSARKSAIDSISTASTVEELGAAWKRINQNWTTFADTPESISSLRTLILDLAVRGKLVAQIESEGDGLDFLSMFPGKSRRLKGMKTVPFEIPKTWTWSALGDVSINRDSERIPISKPIRESRQGPYDYYGASGIIDSFDDYLFDKPLLLIGEDGANLVNRSTPIAFIARGKYWVNNHAHVIDSTSEDALEYLSIVINQMDLKPFLTGTAQPKLNQAKLNQLLIPVPPFDEQKRIVSKVAELMNLCDQLVNVLSERDDITMRIAGALSNEVAA